MRELHLTQGYVAKVDEADYDRLKRYEWHAHVSRPGLIYARANVGGRRVYLHRFILGAGKGQVVDHINRDGLDCRRANLRITDHAGNNRNRRGWQSAVSQYKGVSFRRNRGKWQAHICHEGRVIYLGYFPTELDAARAYDEAARELHGEYAYTNF